MLVRWIYSGEAHCMNDWQTRQDIRSLLGVLKHFTIPFAALLDAELDQSVPHGTLPRAKLLEIYNVVSVQCLLQGFLISFGLSIDS